MTFSALHPHLRLLFIICLGFSSLAYGQSDSVKPPSTTTLPPALIAVQKHINRSQFAKALPLVEDYLKINPNDIPGRFMLGISLSGLSNTNEAIAVFTKLTEDAPEMAEPYNNLAVLHAKSGDLDQARLALEMAVRANPDYAVAHENLGDIYSRLAAQQYQKSQSLDAFNKPLDKKLKTLSEVVEISPQAFVPRNPLPNRTTSSLPF